jgi:adenylate cyclase
VASVGVEAYESAGLLAGLDAKGRSDRIALLDRLTREGFSLGELIDAAALERLVLLPVERALTREHARYTSVEVAERTGLPLELLTQLWLAMGFADPGPEEVAFTEPDVKAAKTVAEFLAAGIPLDAIVRITRVMAHDASRLSETIRFVVGESLIQAGDSELDVGLRYADAAEQLVPMLTPLLEYMLAMHLKEQIKSDLLTQAELAAGKFESSVLVGAGFVDVVGFTQLGERIEAFELGAAAAELVELTHEVIGPPVKLIKSLGDAVLLVSPDVEALVAAGLSIVDKADATESSPRLRMGIATGEAISRGGDWFGRPVNLASRLTGAARPGSVLTVKAVRDQLRDEFSFSFAGERRFKGIRDQVSLYRVRVKPDATT